ncbi:uncharacterized protein LOC132038194 [Lycium ferocissimum]|uniref:uncharacterized protein LOC132038194 n=1 Tax=Lycium ferocissimum TaxID=112874 RepID=UPI0028166349|nr:uncharacterized protein LOC132038194 [Lycium ferocissimum]
MVYVGDDDDDEWACVAPKNLVADKEKLFSSSSSSSSSLSPPSSSSSSSTMINYREVKIRITKKELEKILAGKIDNMEKVTMEQLLSGFLNSSNNSFDSFENIQRQRSWRPRLQSIPEAN